MSDVARMLSRLVSAARRQEHAAGIIRRYDADQTKLEESALSVYERGDCCASCAVPGWDDLDNKQDRRLVHLRASLKRDALPEHAARLKRLEADRG